LTPVSRSDTDHIVARSREVIERLRYRFLTGDPPNNGEQGADEAFGRPVVLGRVCARRVRLGRWLALGGALATLGLSVSGGAQPNCYAHVGAAAG
jgi:hypothetical protein